jgi:excisionase family DNA binding protein
VYGGPAARASANARVLLLGNVGPPLRSFHLWGAVKLTDRLLDAREVADWLGVPVSWVRESTRSGAMPYVELGRYRRCRRAAVEAWLEECSKPGRGTTLREHR